MPLETPIVLLACVGHLCVLVIALSRAQRSVLARDLMLLCLAFFGWTFAAWAYEESNDFVWHVIDASISPLVPPLGLWLVATFVGKRRVLKPYLWLVTLAFALLSLSSALSGTVPWARAFQQSKYWDFIYLILMLPSMALAGLLLVRHIANYPSEKSRTSLIAIGLMIATTLGSLELGGMQGAGYLATLISAIVLSLAVLKLKLLGPGGILTIVAYALTAVITCVVAHAFLITSFQTQRTLVAYSGVLVMCTVIMVLARMFYELASQRSAEQRLLMLGRVADQLTHDLANPLAAIKGALQFLQEEQRQGRSLDPHVSFIQLMQGEADRLGELSDAYRRMVKFEPQREQTSLLEVLTDAIEAWQLRLPKTIRLTTALAIALPLCSIDVVMLRVAIDNVLKNAVEAMPRGGELHISAAVNDQYALIGIKDTGVGMDAREQEQAFDCFYSTKTTGTGLGLAFVRQALQAHGGKVILSSVANRGTTVSLYIPLQV